jgi:hypothetical protein
MRDVREPPIGVAEWGSFSVADFCRSGLPKDRSLFYAETVISLRIFTRNGYREGGCPVCVFFFKKPGGISFATVRLDGAQSLIGARWQDMNPVDYSAHDQRIMEPAAKGGRKGRSSNHPSTTYNSWKISTNHRKGRIGSFGPEKKGKKFVSDSRIPWPATN